MSRNLRGRLLSWSKAPENRRIVKAAGLIIAVKGNVLSVRRLYKSGKAIILQAMNPKYQTIVVNVFSEDMILGKVETLSREIK